MVALHATDFCRETAGMSQSRRSDASHYCAGCEETPRRARFKRNVRDLSELGGLKRTPF